ncbi:hypothetical protein [Emticicia fontis]
MTQPNETTKKLPSHILYQVVNKENQEKPLWIKTGALWENSDGEGFNVVLEILGQKIQLVARKNKPKSN